MKAVKACGEMHLFKKLLCGVDWLHHRKRAPVRHELPEGIHPSQLAASKLVLQQPCYLRGRVDSNDRMKAGLCGVLVDSKYPTSAIRS
jgi:hypothetical protein